MLAVLAHSAYGKINDELLLRPGDTLLYRDFLPTGSLWSQVPNITVEGAYVGRIVLGTGRALDHGAVS